MALTKEAKKTLIDEYKINDKDTGSPEVQIAVLTKEINILTEHMKEHTQDYHTKSGLDKKVGRRKKLLKYLADEDVNRYRAVVKKLGLRK